MKQKSFIKNTVQMLMLQLILLIAILLIFLYSSYRSSVESTEQMLNNFLQIYGNELENKLENGDRVLERLIYKNNDYDKLQSASETDRYYASINLHKLLEETIVNENNIDLAVIAEGEHQIFLNAGKNGISLSKKDAIRAFALACAKEDLIKAEWKFTVLDATPYLYKMYVWHGRVAGIFISVDSFMETAGNSRLEKMSLMLTDENQQVYGCYGSEIAAFAAGTKVEELISNKTMTKRFSLLEGKFFIYSSLHANTFAGQIKSSMVVFFIVIWMSLISAFLLVRYIRNAILTPMTHMKENMEQIKNGDYQLRITENYDNSEFSMLKDTFNRLMDEIVGLKIKSYEKQIELQETELKSIRLQIRPHFFLNAMTTISSLSMQKKNDEIKIYIDALSKNIRYMFKSGLHTVPLSEEIRHVENYFEMQELKYPNCVFYYIEIEPGLEEWQIPQMLIHTVIENEYKYAVALDTMLTILVKAGSLVMEGETFLTIEIEDDGKGYPGDVLMQFQKTSNKPGEDGSRVGLWSIRRMLEIMYERNDLFQISNIEPHGCFNRFLIPANPVREIRNQAEQHKID